MLRVGSSKTLVPWAAALAIACTALTMAVVRNHAADGSTAAPADFQSRQAPHARLSWHFRHAEVHQGDVAKVVVTRAGSSAKSVTLEVRAGKKWRRVATAPIKKNGNAKFKISARSMGRFTYRVRSDGASGPKRTLTVYGDVPLSTLMGTSTQSVLVGGNNISYAWKVNDWAHKVVFDVPVASSCRVLRLKATYVADPATVGADTATVKWVTRESQGSVNVADGKTLVFAAPVAGRAFQLMVENSPGQTLGDGFGECWSVTGRG